MKRLKQNRKKHNILFKYSIKEIFVNRKRFISIMLMALLGVGFFAGLVASGPDMRDSLDKFLDDTNTYDINIVSTLGLTNEDVDEIKKIKNTENVHGIYSKDISFKTDDKEFIFKVIEYSEKINTPILLDGKLLENNNECVVEQDFLIDSGFKIGDNIEIDEDDELKANSFKIVGSVKSPIYVSMERGTTSLGDGTIDYYLYLNKDVFDMDYYPNIYLNVNSAKIEKITTNKYNELVENVYKDIENIKEERETQRYNNIKEEASEKLQESIDEYEKGKKEGEAELKKAKDKIEDSEKEIKNVENELETGKTKAKKEISNAKAEISSSENKLKKSEKEYEEGLEKYSKGVKEYNSNKSKLESSLDVLNDNLKKLKDLKEKIEIQIALIEDEIKNGNLENEDKLVLLKNQLSDLNSNIKEIESNKNKINNELSSAEKELNKTKKALDSAKKEIDNGYKELEKGKKELSSRESSLNNQFAKAEKEIEDGKKEIVDAKETLEKEEKKFNEEIKDAEKEIEDAKEDIEGIKEGKWYIFDREDDTGFSSFIDSINSMNNIATLFPIIFYLVAILISSTSMSRMVEEERGDIGTLKALGYSNLRIINKYIAYSLLSTVLGGIIGMFIGFILIPTVVWENYSIIYYLPEFYPKLRFSYGILGTVIAVICITGSTVHSAYKELKDEPSSLMRPKAPKMGKKVILEKIPFIWKRLNFSSKTTVRNVFRYKKRALMTIIGISGCTALILAGFGLRDSIKDIAEYQYGRVFEYDLVVSLNKEDEELVNLVKDSDIVESVSLTDSLSGSISADGIKRDTSIIVVEDTEDFKNVANLRDIDSGNIIELSNEGVLISDKLASLLEIEKGENITLTDSDNNEFEYKVLGIVENYIGHYVYINKDLYESKENDFNINTLFIKYKEGNNDNEAFEEMLLDDNSVTSITVVENSLEHVRDLLKSLDLVVMILIVSSALLAFVVLYNLANVNISERVREIATLKVLGFYDKEVDNYINRESIILTCIGIVIGLIAGVFLTGFVISTCETENMRFARNILLHSYIYSILITSVFSIIVNFATHFVLKKINMVESLKSIE